MQNEGTRLAKLALGRSKIEFIPPIEETLESRSKSTTSFAKEQGYLSKECEDQLPNQARAE